MPAETRATPWRAVLLTCGKCARKLDGGYGPKGKETLRIALRGELREAGHGRSVRVIETRCLGLCPKKAVAALNGGHPGTIVAIPKHMAADEALALLLST